MNILSYNSTYVGSGHNAGAEVTLHDINRLVKREGHRVSVLASRPFEDGSGSYVADGVLVNAYSSKHDPFLYFPRAQLILSQLECAARASLIGQELMLPTVQLVHNYTDYSLGISKYCDALVYNSDNTRVAIEKHLGGSRLGTVLYPLVDPNRYRVDRPTVDDGYITLVNLSDGTDPFYDKGHRVFYYLAQRYPHLRFLGVEGAYGNQDIREMKNVTIIPHQQNALEIYRKSAVILMPSTVESFGRVAVEAAASGIPSLVTDLAGPREADVAYDYINPEDFEGWDRALSYLLRDYDYASELTVERSKKLWVTTQSQIPRFLELIDELVGGV